MTIFFFIRTHNDIDHGLPLLDYLVRNKSLKIRIYAVGEGYKEFKRHISYIEDVLCLQVESFEDRYYSTTNRFILSILDRIGGCNGRTTCLIHNLIVANLRELCWWLSSGSARKFIENLPGNSIVMADFGTEKTFPLQYIIRFAKKSMVPTISYNHGYNIFSNLDAIKIKKPKLPQLINNFITRFFFHKRQTEYYDKYYSTPTI